MASDTKVIPSSRRRWNISLNIVGRLSSRCGEKSRYHYTTADAGSVNGRYRLRTSPMAWPLHPSPPLPRTQTPTPFLQLTESSPITHSQPVEIRHGQLPRIETEDGAEQEIEEEDDLISASVTESTTTTDVVPSHARKRTLDEVDGDEGLEYADDAYVSEDADAVSSNGADDYGDTVYLQDAASLYGKHTAITPPIAKVQLSVTTATPTAVVNLTPTKKRRISGSYSPARGRKQSSEELETDDLEYESPCEQRETMAKRVKTSPEPVNGEKPPAVILRVPPHLT